jgi:heme/copper-type cytochrome/quinol oxidase subunit 3
MAVSLAEQQVLNKSRRALRFIGLSLAVYVAAGLISLVGFRWIPRIVSQREAIFPAVFWLSTPVLLAGSIALHRAVGFVRWEKQRQFRKALLQALVLGVLFVGLQGCGLKMMLDHQDPSESQTGSNAFLTVISTLHAMHFTVALWWLLWVLISAWDDRYDHESFWGVTACGWFWHGLGGVWGVVLLVFLVATCFQ